MFYQFLFLQKKKKSLVFHISNLYTDIYVFASILIFDSKITINFSF